MKIPRVSDLLKRYLVVGTVSYIIEMACLYSLRSIAGVSPVKSVAISFWIGFAVAFILQKKVAFQNHDRRAHIVARQLYLYSLLVAWNYIFTLLMVELLNGFMSVFAIRTLAILIITSWNFMIYKYLFKTSEL